MSNKTKATATVRQEQLDKLTSKGLKASFTHQARSKHKRLLQIERETDEEIKILKDRLSTVRVEALEVLHLLERLGDDEYVEEQYAESD